MLCLQIIAHETELVSGRFTSTYTKRGGGETENVTDLSGTGFVEMTAAFKRKVNDEIGLRCE